MASEEHKAAQPPSLMRNRDFLLFQFGRLTNVIGTQMIVVAVGWHVYLATEDPFFLGLVGLAEFAPALALFLVAGMTADRFDRRRILLVCNIVHALVAGLLLACVTIRPDLIWPIFAILTLHGTARSFYFTASQAILPNLVAHEHFPRAVAWASSVNKAAQLAGPALGGVLLALVGDGVYLASTLSFAVAAVSVGLIATKLAVHPREPFGLAKVLGGFRFIRDRKIVLGAVSMDLMAVLFGGVMGIMPVFAHDILHVGAEGLGVLRAMPGFGSVAVGLVLTRIATPRHLGRLFFISVAIFGVSIVVFGLSTSFWLSLVALAIYGGSDMISVWVRLMMIQIATPDAMRGRVSAVNGIAINASNELGDFRAGMMASAFGTVPAVVAGGAVTLAVGAIWAWRFPQVRKVDRIDDI